MHYQSLSFKTYLTKYVVIQSYALLKHYLQSRKLAKNSSVNNVPQNSQMMCTLYNCFFMCNFGLAACLKRVPQSLQQ